jgi:uncharacterized protein (TIGR02996 family)
MTTTQTGNSLLSALLKNPEDTVRMLVYADWNEEQGKEIEADCWRWFAKKKTLPEELGKNRFWWNDEDYSSYPNLKNTVLPNVWVWAMDDMDHDKGEDTPKRFPKIRLAFTEAVKVWVEELTPSQRKQCWRWNP